MSNIDYWLLENYKKLSDEELRLRFKLNIGRDYVPVAMYLCPNCKERQMLNDDYSCPVCNYAVRDTEGKKFSNV